MFKCTSEPKSKEAVQEAVEYLFDNFEYTDDAWENWGIDLSDLLDGKLLKDDCDGYVHAMAVFLWICGFNLSEIALCITDVDPFDDSIYDHVVIGIYVDDEWVFCQNWIGRVLSCAEIKHGGYNLKDFRASGMKFVQYRLLDHSSSDWLEGFPKYVG